MSRGIAVLVVATLLGSVALCGPARGGADEGRLVVAKNQKAVKRMLKSQEAQRAALIAAASAALEADPARAARWLPFGDAERTTEPEVAASYGGHPGLRLRFLSNETMMLGLGSSVLAGKDKANLARLYATLHRIIPAKYTAEFETPSKLSRRPLGIIRNELVRMLEMLHGGFELIRVEISETFAESIGTGFLPDCETELGWEYGGSVGEVSDAHSSLLYSPRGILRNLHFALKDDLTCVKDQGARGSCWAHAIAAAVETQVLVNGGEPENLSEQHIVFRGKVTTDWLNRYVDGAYVSGTLRGFVDSRYRIPHESTWNYNRSLFRATDPDPATHEFALSCSMGYTGEHCTDFAFQATEIIALPPGAGVALSIRYAYPAPPANDGHVITGFTQIPDLGALPYPGGGSLLDLVVLLVEGRAPVILSFAVPIEFLTPDSDGYVRHVAGSQPIGSHAVLIVGFIANADLPAEVDPDPSGRGYFVVKNSWGTSYADCGFVYVSGEFLEQWGFEYVTIASDLD